MARSHKVSKPKKKATDSSESYNALMVLMADNVRKHKKSRPQPVQEQEVVVNQSEDEEATSADENQIEGVIDTADAAKEEDEDREETAAAVSDDQPEATDVDGDDHFDPYQSHFNPTESLYVSAVKTDNWKTTSKKVKLDKTSYKVTYGDLETSSTIVDFEEAQQTSLVKYTIRPKIRSGFELMNGSLTSTQEALYPSLLAYRDVCFGSNNLVQTEELSKLMALHIAQHVVRGGEDVSYNNRLLHKGADAGEVDLEFRDQGYTRAKVLVLLPTKNACYEFVQLLVAASGVVQQQNKTRFKDAFHEDGAALDNKPEDFQKAFKGNSDDMFCLGVKLRSQFLRYYSSFYMADIILASPLGLKMIVGSEGEAKRDYDFLSSIEIVYLHEANHLEMQSWDNVLTILKHTNLMPTEAHGCDFSRVKSWHLDGLAKNFRQTVISCQYVTPTINSVISQCHNIGGRTKIAPVYEGELASAGMKIRQVFTRFQAASIEEEIDARFKAFVSITLEGMVRSGDFSGTLIYVPTYIELVRLRNYLDEKNISFGAVSEYSSVAEVKRHRALFREGREKILLYTGRLHHYRRYFVKGVKSVVLYKLPDNPAFYRELLLFMALSVDEGVMDASMARCRALFTNWDLLALERIVGTSRVRAMARSSESSYEFY